MKALIVNRLVVRGGALIIPTRKEMEFVFNRRQMSIFVLAHMTVKTLITFFFFSIVKSNQSLIQVHYIPCCEI